MRRPFIAWSLAFLLGVALCAATSNVLTVSIHSLAGTAGTNESTNYSMTFNDLPFLAHGATNETSNLTHNNSAPIIEAQVKVIPPTPPGDDDDDDSSSSSSSSSSSYSLQSTTPTETDPTADKAFTKYVSSENLELVVTSAREDLSLEQLVVSLTEDKKLVRIKVVEAGDHANRGELQSFKGQTYRLFEIEHENLADELIERATITFKVDKDWVYEQGVDREDIKLYRYVVYSWVPLSTSYERQDADHYYYEAKSPGLSVFMIGYEQEEQAPLIEEEEEGQQDLITGEAITDTTPQAAAQDAPVKEKKGKWWLWALVIIIVGGIAVFLFKEKPIGSQPKGTLVSSAPASEKVQEVPTSKPVPVRTMAPLFKKPDDERKLTAFLRHVIENGHQVSKFKDDLIAHGWTEAQIDYCVDKLTTRR